MILISSNRGYSTQDGIKHCSKSRSNGLVKLIAMAGYEP